MKIINIPRTFINSNCLKLAYLIYIYILNLINVYILIKTLKLNTVFLEIIPPQNFRFQISKIPPLKKGHSA